MRQQLVAHCPRPHRARGRRPSKGMPAKPRPHTLCTVCCLHGPNGKHRRSTPAQPIHASHAVTHHITHPIIKTVIAMMKSWAPYVLHCIHPPCCYLWMWGRAQREGADSWANFLNRPPPSRSARGPAMAGQPAGQPVAQIILPTSRPACKDCHMPLPTTYVYRLQKMPHCMYVSPHTPPSVPPADAASRSLAR